MIEKNSKLWKSLADVSESPGEFIKNVMNLRKMTPVDVASKIGTTDTYVRLLYSDKAVPAVKACYSLAKILNIDPYLLNRICSDYKMKQTIEQNEK